MEGDAIKVTASIEEVFALFLGQFRGPILDVALCSMEVLIQVSENAERLEEQSSEIPSGVPHADFLEATEFGLKLPLPTLVIYVAALAGVLEQRVN